MLRLFAALALAIGITTTMDATGYLAFSALPLAGLLLLFWRWRRGFYRDVGLVWGRARGYGWALAYPVIVLGVLIAVAAVTGAVDTAGTDWGKAGINVLLVTVSTIIVATVTEEGFFRGLLWEGLERQGWSRTQILAATSVAFALWHVSAVVLPTGYEPEASQVPVYLVNATVMGAAWGIVRAESGSVIAAALCHGLWNGVVYPLFGFGKKVGALGIEETSIYGPEIGWLGLALNVCFVAFALVWLRRSSGGQGSVEARTEAESAASDAR